MKKQIVFLLLCCPVLLAAQEKTETIRKEFQFPTNSIENLLYVSNIFGDITIESHSGNQIIVEVIKTIKASTTQNMQAANAEIKVAMQQGSDILVLKMNTPCTDPLPDKLSRETFSTREHQGWKNNCQWNPSYQYKLDYKIKVPKAISVHASTINNGDVVIHGVAGEIVANNINGSIELKGVQAAIDARTINGDLEVYHDKNPTTSSSYNSFNGTVNAYFQPGLGANVFFKSFNGDLFTSMEEVDSLPLTVSTEESSTKKGIKHKIQTRSGFKIGKGGPELNFETFNGNVYIREQ